MKAIFFSFFFIFFTCLSFGQPPIRLADIRSSEKVLSLHFTQSQEDSLLENVNSRARVYEQMHHYGLDNSVPVTMVQHPLLPGYSKSRKQLPVNFVLPEGIELPKDINDLAFCSISQLASLLRNKKITSVELTRFFMDRLKKFGDTLHCVISLTEKIAMRAAAEADKETAEGNYRGLLQGIPYGLKDLFAVRGTRTTWGAAPYKKQVIDNDSYVYSQLQKAGAVLIAKLSMGALAMNDYWFGGQTRNPWKMTTGSSGSSAGSAAATVAGLVPFAIGTETYGSIISPSTVCGATALRPTFGAVSRYGAMTLAWSLDKAGPICRSAEDAAIVFNYLHGTDGRDASAVSMPFNYRESADLSRMRIAYAKNYFGRKDTLGNENTVLDVLRKAGATLIPVDFPDSGIYHFNMIGIIIGAESAAAFDGFTRSGMDDSLLRQGKNDWPNSFRASRLIPAVEYINANRHRYLLMQKVKEVLEKYDVFICPTWVGNQPAITNLTGNPAVCFPTGFNQEGLPTSITLIGNLFEEASLLEVAKIYQDLTQWNGLHPGFFQKNQNKNK